MSNPSQQPNEPTQVISVEEFFEPKISIDNTNGKIWLFFGNTPKAQLGIDLTSDFATGLGAEMVRGMVVSKFPQGKLN